MFNQFINSFNHIDHWMKPSSTNNHTFVGVCVLSFGLLCVFSVSLCRWDLWLAAVFFFSSSGSAGAAGTVRPAREKNKRSLLDFSTCWTISGHFRSGRTFKSSTCSTGRDWDVCDEALRTKTDAPFRRTTQEDQILFNSRMLSRTETEVSSGGRHWAEDTAGGDSESKMWL